MNTISRFSPHISSSLFPIFSPIFNYTVRFHRTPLDQQPRQLSSSVHQGFRRCYQPTSRHLGAAVFNAVVHDCFTVWNNSSRDVRGEYIFFSRKKKKKKKKRINKSTAAAESDYLRDQSSRVCVSSRSFSAVGQWLEFLRTFFTITSYAILCLGSRVIDELQQDRNASLHRRLNSVRSFALLPFLPLFPFFFFPFVLFYFSPLLSLYTRDRMESRAQD